MAYSPDGRYILLGLYLGSTSPYYQIVVLDRSDSNSLTTLTAPTQGTSNARITGVAWYPDNDTYVVAGYVNGVTHIGSVSSGGVIKDLEDGGEVTGSVYSVIVLNKDRFNHY